jgi:hypothetical protein
LEAAKAAGRVQRVRVDKLTVAETAMATPLFGTILASFDDRAGSILGGTRKKNV